MTRKNWIAKRTSAAESIISGALASIEPTFAEVFDRLTPHPTFTELRARQDYYYGKSQILPVVRDPGRDVTANPLLVFSEGQLNTVAFHIFLDWLSTHAIRRRYPS